MEHQVNDLGTRDVGFMSLTEGFDTTTPNGKLIFSIFGALAEFERAIIRERINAGLEAARARGIKLGRKKKLNNDQVEYIKFLAKEQKKSIKEICREFGISHMTVYRILKPEKYSGVYN